MPRPTVCFFAKVHPAELSRVGFYSEDLAMLDDLGYNVRVATTPREIHRADLFVAWWWTWAFVPLLHPARRGAPLVVTGTFNHWMFHTRPAHQRGLMRLALRGATANIFHSHREYESVPASFQTRNPYYIPPAIDCESFRPNGAHRSPFTFTVATMPNGNGERKCIPEIIHAAPLIRARHPGMRIIIAGVIDPAYVALARELGASEYVSFPGTVSREEKVSLMQRCSVYLQPSRFEGFGVAIAEALASGAPVVTSAVGEVPEVVGSAAHLVDGTDPVSIANGVTDVLCRPDAGAAMGRAGRERVIAHFARPTHRDRWSRILATV